MVILSLIFNDGFIFQKNSDRLRARWFQHATIMEFREALVAHAAFRTPKFLFQQHDGTKVMQEIFLIVMPGEIIFSLLKLRNIVGLLNDNETSKVSTTEAVM